MPRRRSPSRRTAAAARQRDGVRGSRRAWYSSSVPAGPMHLGDHPSTVMLGSPRPSRPPPTQHGPDAVTEAAASGPTLDLSGPCCGHRRCGGRHSCLAFTSSSIRCWKVPASGIILRHNNPSPPPGATHMAFAAHRVDLAKTTEHMAARRPRGAHGSDDRNATEIRSGLSHCGPRDPWSSSCQLVAELFNRGSETAPLRGSPWCATGPVGARANAPLLLHCRVGRSSMVLRADKRKAPPWPTPKRGLLLHPWVVGDPRGQPGGSAATGGAAAQVLPGSGGQ